MTQIVNGLAATRTRRNLVRAVLEPGRIYFERAAGEVYDLEGIKVTARVKELIRHEWIRAARDDERRPGESATRIYYRLTDFGRAALKGER